MLITKGASTDTLTISNECEVGSYDIKIYLTNYPDVSFTDNLELTYPSGYNNYILKLNNDSNIVVPENNDYINYVSLNGKILLNGVDTGDTGIYELVSSESIGISIENGHIKVLPSAEIGKDFVVKYSFNTSEISKTFTLVDESSGSTDEIIDSSGQTVNGIFENIVLSGFDSDKLQTKYLTYDDNSGEVRTISFTCYDDLGTVVSTPNIKIETTDGYDGVYIEPDYVNNKVNIYANGIYVNKNFTLSFYSGEDLVLEQEIVLCPPNTWDATMDFTKYYFTKSDSFSSYGTFSNYTSSEMEVSLVLVFYDKDNKIVDYNVNNKLVGPGETNEFKAKIILPGNLNNVSAKTFFINGTDITDSSRIFTSSKTLTNREVN